MNKWIPISILLIIIAGSGVYFMTKDKTPSNITCISDELLKTHYHYTVTIYANGKQIDIPENVGISGSCIQEVHTHEQPNLVHFESEKNDDTTRLNEFLNILYQDKNFELSTDNFISSDNSTLTINGIDMTNSFLNYTMMDGDKVVLNLTGRYL